MQFETDAQKACYEKILPWMRELFGELASPREDVPGIYIMIGSAVAQVAVYPWGKDDATITARSYVVTGVETTPDLLQFLLQQNDSMRFGAFGLDQDCDIFFEHTIVGSTCDKAELRASTMAVISTADRMDEQIVSRWGGQRAADHRQ